MILFYASQENFLYFFTIVSSLEAVLDCFPHLFCNFKPPDFFALNNIEEIFLIQQRNDILI